MSTELSVLPQYEYIDSKALADRWHLPESWVREHVRSRNSDPIPHVRFGKYVRFRWGSPELESWAKQRNSSFNNGFGEGTQRKKALK